MLHLCLALETRRVKPSRRLSRCLPALLLAVWGCIASPVRVWAQAATGVTFTLLHSFNGGVGEGTSPRGDLVLGSDGFFYGTTNGGGASNSGSVFKMTAAGALTMLHSFATYFTNQSNADGAQPYGGLVQAGDGYFYGTTSTGGAGGGGTVFKVSSSGTFATLFAFGAVSGSGVVNVGGSNPVDALIVGGDGNLYGDTSAGGADGYGTMFEITLSNGALTTLYNVALPLATGTGAGPRGRLLAGSDGDLYGTAALGGAYREGAIFGLSTSDGNIDDLHDMSAYGAVYASGNTDGAQVDAGLTLGEDGALYGVASRQGPYGYGTVFKVTTAGVFTVLHSFGSTDGSEPEGDLALGGDGNFYGTASLGGSIGSGNGTVFQMTPAGKLTTLYAFSAYSGGVSFGNADGARPQAGLIVGADGDLYGTAAVGGAYGNGSAFKIALASSLLPVNLSAFTLNPSTVAGGQASVGTVSVSRAAPTGGITVALASSNTAAASVPASVTIAAGATSAVFAATSYPVAATTSATITASYGGGAISAPLTVTAATITPTPTAAVRFDFNKDGHADLIWYNTISGGVSIWNMNDQSVLKYGADITNVAPSSGWVPVAAPDVNGDGYPDLLWWNERTGELSVWTLNNTVVTNYGSDFAQVTDTTWKPVAVADNAGSAWTLVFQNTATGGISRWLMSGTTVTSYGVAISTLGAGSPYQIVGAPDLNGDGKSDLLFWDDQTGGVSWWGMDLANQKALSFNGNFAQVPDTSWHLMGSEDTNGDGHPDLIWWNANSGIESRWLLNGTTVTQYGGVSAQVSDITWQPTAIR